MKLYMFDKETGLYLGQDFGAESEVDCREGITDVAPPDFHHGETPVFDFTRKQWAVIEINKLRPVLTQKRRGSHEA